MNLRANKFGKLVRVGAVAVIGVIAMASSGSAQSLSLVAGPLNPVTVPLVDSATNLQQSSLAYNIATICPQLIGLGYFGAPSAVGDLTTRCTGMVVTAAQGQTAEASNALQEVAAEEMAAQQAAVASATASQFGAIAGRVAEILASRGGQGGTSFAQAYPTFGPGIQVASTDPVQVAQLASEDNETPLNSRLGGFATGRYRFGDHSATALEDGYDYYDAGGTFGADYMLTSKVTVGGTFGYSRRNNDFSNDGGSIKTDSYVLGAYSVWFPTPALSISGYLAYGFVNYDTNRHILYTDAFGPIDRHANGSTNGNTFEFTANGYYDFPLGAATVGPVVRLSYLRSTVSGFTESGAQGLNMRFNDQKATSFQTRFGGAGTYPISTPIGVMTLQGHAEWIHEYAADSRTIDLKFAADPFSNSPTILVTTDSPDRDRLGLGAGASLILPHGITTFVNFDTVVGQANYSTYILSVGARIPL